MPVPIYGRSLKGALYAARELSAALGLPALFAKMEAVICNRDIKNHKQNEFVMLSEKIVLCYLEDLDVIHVWYI